MDDISGLSDKSFAGVKDFEEKATIQGGLSRIITSEGTQIAGYPAQKILYAEGSEGTPDSDRFKKMKVILVAYDREYVIAFDASSADSYDDYIATFEIC